MRRILPLLLFVALSFAYAQDASTTTAAPTGDATSSAATSTTSNGSAAATTDTTTPAATTDGTSTAPTTSDSTAPAATTDGTATTPSTTETATPSATTAPAGSADLLAEVERLGAKLEEANTVIDELRAQANELRDKADASDAAAKAAQAQAAASDQAAKDAQAKADASDQTAKDALAKAAASDQAAQAAEAKVAELGAKAAQADQLAAEATQLRAQAAELEAKIAELEKQKQGITDKMLSFGDLKLNKADYPQVLLSGFSGAQKRMGSWSIDDSTARQTDPRQFFSRLTFPVVQSATPTLYSFDVSAGAKGWVGAGLHFFSGTVRRPHGYGEGRSLLVWLTRDPKVRGGNQTYLQLYRSDDDVNMSRVLDALIKEGVTSWRHVDVLYDPSAEFVVIAIDGSVRAAYRTFFGIGAGVSVSLRTLGEGVAFRNFEVRR